MIVVNDQCPIGLNAPLKTVVTENIGDSFKSQPNHDRMLTASRLE